MDQQGKSHSTIRDTQGTRGLHAWAREGGQVGSAPLPVFWASSTRNWSSCSQRACSPQGTVSSARVSPKAGQPQVGPAACATLCFPPAACSWAGGLSVSPLGASGP